MWHDKIVTVPADVNNNCINWLYNILEVVLTYKKKKKYTEKSADLRQG